MAGLSIPVQRNLDSYREKIIGNLTARTLVALVSGVAVETAIGALVYFVLGIPPESVSFLFLIAAVPFFAIGFWTHKGNPWMTAERFLPLWVKYNFDETVSVKRSSFHAAGIDGKLDKEVLTREFSKKAAKTRGKRCAEIYLARIAPETQGLQESPEGD